MDVFETSSSLIVFGTAFFSVLSSSIPLVSMLSNFITATLQPPDNLFLGSLETGIPTLFAFGSSTI